MTNRNFQFVGGGVLCQKVRAAHTRPMHRPSHSIHEWRRNFNPVMRVGAFSEGLAEKAAKGYGYHSRVNSGQTTPHKEIDRLSSGLASGGVTAPCKALLQGNADIRDQVPHYFRPRAVTVGAKSDPLHGCAVNGAETMATGQSVSTPSGVAPTVRRVVSKAGERAMNFHPSHTEGAA